MRTTGHGLSNALRTVHHAVFHASRDGRCSEVVAWSNAIASVALGAGVFVLTHAWPAALLLAVVSFVLLRAALMNRLTVWVAAAFGTLAVSSAGGGLAWLFAHLIETSPSAPVIAGVLGAVAAAILPAWAYGRLARRREHTRDSLFDPVSVPSSRG